VRFCSFGLKKWDFEAGGISASVFGPLKSYEEMVKSVVGQYLELLAKKA
jgi:hypothetical protein